MVCWEKAPVVIFYQCMHMVRSWNPVMPLTWYCSCTTHVLCCVSCLLGTESGAYQHVMMLSPHASLQSASNTSSVNRTSTVCSCMERMVLCFHMHSGKALGLTCCSAASSNDLQCLQWYLPGLRQGHHGRRGALCPMCRASIQKTITAKF